MIHKTFKSEIASLDRDYQPSAETVNDMKAVSLVATVGPSASGKSTIMKSLALTDSSFHFVVGETSRAPRMGERSGIDLFFRSKQDILNDLAAGRLTQIVVGPNGDLYCTRVENFPHGKICLFPLVPQGVRQFRVLPLQFFSAAFIVPASFELWQQWLSKQAKISGWSQDKMTGRLREAISSYEFALNDSKIRFVLNDDIPKAAARLAQVAAGQTPVDEKVALSQAQVNYQKLKRIIS